MVLKFLLEKQEADENRDIDKTTTSHLEIARAKNIKPFDIVRYHEVLIDRDHIKCDEKSINGEHRITLRLNGRTAALEDSHYHEGVKHMHDNVFVFFGWVIPTLALVVSAIGTCNNFSAEIISERLQRQIDSLRQELIQVKQDGKNPSLKDVPTPN